MKKVKEIIKQVYAVFGELCPRTATKILFRKYLGYKLNLKKPVTINEKMQYLKLFVYKNHPLVTKCADKYAVREYVKECGCEEILVPLLGVWEKADDIDFAVLPDKFVLKCNHGSGSNIICKDKGKIDVNETRQKLTRWLGEDFGKQRVEMSYKHINRKIIAETFIETKSGKAPIDYKIFCAYGVPKFILVASDRGEQLKFDFFTPNWEWMPATQDNCPNAGADALMKPNTFNKMLEYAGILSKPFPLVRVDFYNEFDKIYFGELTFLDAGGLSPYQPFEYEKKFGEMIDVDISKGIIL